MNFFRKIVLGLITLMMAGALIIAMKFLLFDKEAGAQVGPQKQSQTTGVKSGPTTLVKVKIKEIKDTGFLRLINAQHSTSTTKDSDLVKSEDGLFRYQKVIRPDLIQFMDFAKQKNSSLYIASAFRSKKDQEEIYATTKDKSLVQLPGNSEHQTGLALDLQPVKALKGVFGDGLKKEIEFMANNSWRYGFIQRYPKGKQDITGISFEYWHYRYVGRPHAEYMFKNDLVLEEYLDLIKYKGELKINTSEGDYRVYWRESESGIIQFIGTNDYVISSTNTGAYLITVKVED